MSLTRQSIIGPYARAVLCDTANGQLLVPSTDFIVGHCLAFHGAYDLAKVQALTALLPPSARVLVVGAHVGALVVPLAGVARTVVAVEPNPVILPLLRANLVLNELHNVTVLPYAAGSTGGVASFLQSQHNSGGSKIARGDLARSDYRYDAPSQIMVRVESLDRLMVDPAFDLIVLDAEGSEFAALQGMAQILANSRYLYMEYSPQHFRDLAHVTQAEILALLLPRWTAAALPDGSGWTSARPLQDVLMGLWETDTAADVLLSPGY